MTADDIDDDAHFEIREGLESEEIDGERVVFDLDRDAYFSMNDVAGRVWEGLERGDAFGEIVDAIVEVYDVDRDRARSDAADFLDEAQSHDLVERVGET